MAQPTCAINIGPDHTICAGYSATLQGPAGFGNYLWSNGAVTQNTSVGTAGDYWCQVTYPSGNLVTNGDFSAGNTGFTSQFTYSPVNVQNEGMYTVGLNASWYHNQFQGTGTGNFLIGNAGYVSWLNGQLNVWCQTIPCCPGQTYTLSFRARTLSNALPARAVWNMDGNTVMWPDFTFPAYSAGWQLFSTTWTAAPGQTSVNACIRITSGDGIGDDFGIDDINIAGTIVLRDTLHVSVTPLPTVGLGPDFSLCQGDAVTLDATTPNATYIWQDGSSNPTFIATAGGSYSVAVTANNCTNTDQVNITSTPLPTVQLGPDTLLCTGSTLLLSATGPGYSYLWQNGSGAPTFTVASPGLYWAEVTGNNCKARDSIVVAYKQRPSVFLGNDTSFCAGPTLLLHAAWPGATYLWQDGSSASSLPVQASGIYQVTVDLNGCSAQDDIQVQVIPAPIVDIGPDTTVCPGTPVTFNAALPGATYLWNNGSQSPQFTTSVAGTFAVLVTANGCAASDTVTLAHFNLQSVNLGPDRLLCAGSSVRVGTTVSGATYAWNTGATTDSITIASAGTFWVDATLNGCTVRDSIHVSIVPLPVVSIGPDRQVCPGTQITLNAATPGGSYLWSNGTSGPTIAAGLGTWSVEVTVNGCKATGAMSITESTPPTVNLGPDTMLCPGAVLVLNAGPPNITYTWSTGTTGPTASVLSPATISVTAMDAQGCIASDAITVTYATIGHVSLGADTTICAGSQIMLDATLPNAGTYTWSTGTSGPTLTTGNAGLYWVHATSNGCLVGDTIAVGVAPLPVVFIGNDTTLCPGASLVLNTPTTGDQFHWQNGSSASSFTVTTAGGYSLSATNGAGCTTTAHIQVQFLSPGSLYLGPDTAICAGSTIQLNGGLPGGSTVWSGAVAASTPTISTSTAGTFIANTTVAGCIVTDSITITLLALPSVSVGPDMQLCSGSSVQLTANGPSLLWDDGSTAPLRSVSHGGIYWVRASANGCFASDTIHVTENPVPVVSLGPDTSVCANGQVPVNISVPGGSYLWSDGNTAPQRNLAPGTWSVVVAMQGCHATDSLLIHEIPYPIIQLPSDTTLCTGASWLMDVSQPGATFLWSTGNTGATLLASSAGTYSVVVDRNGCTTTGQVHVAHVNLSSFTLGPDTTICPGAMFLLNIGVPGATVLWEDGSSSLHRPISGAGQYHATITFDGCTANASRVVSVTTVPPVNLGPDLSRCLGDSVLLQVAPGAAQLVWNTGATAPTLAVTSSGLFWASLTLNGCIESDTVRAVFSPVDSILDLGPDQRLCPGNTLRLDATKAGATYLWNNGSHLPLLDVIGPGTYSVQVEGHCIHAVDTIHIQEGLCTPSVYIPNAFTPDADGINDLFSPTLDGKVLTWKFLVFSRWGGLLFSSDVPGAAWDGTYHGSELPIGVYTWSLHYTAVTDEGVVQVKRTGKVTLLR